VSDRLTSTAFLNHLATRLTQNSEMTAHQNSEILDQAMSLFWDYSDDATRAVACDAKWQTGLVSIGSTTYKSLILTFFDCNAFEDVAMHSMHRRLLDVVHCNAFEDAALHSILGRLLDVVHGITGLDAIVSVCNGHGISIEYDKESDLNRYIFRSF